MTPPVDDLALLGRVKEIYEKAVALVRSIVDRARANGDTAGAIAHIEDVLDTLRAHPNTHDGVNQTLADLKTFDEALSRNDAAADKVLRDKFSGVDKPD